MGDGGFQKLVDVARHAARNAEGSGLRRELEAALAAARPEAVAELVEAAKKILDDHGEAHACCEKIAEPRNEMTGQLTERCNLYVCGVVFEPDLEPLRAALARLEAREVKP